MIPISKPIPTGVRPRIEFPSVDLTVIHGRLGPAHRQQREGDSEFEFWLFEVGGGVTVMIEYISFASGLIVHSDSTDTTMLRTELGLADLPSSDFRPPS
ncbi:hypothetical protein KKC22_13540 [Myxococcota bacterium]|nr:hypothetical protein [Myxococcota bacterium]